jgi:hypothetical protein
LPSNSSFQNGASAAESALGGVMRRPRSRPTAAPMSGQTLPARVKQGDRNGQVAGGGLYSWESNLATLDFLRAALLS